MFKEKIDKYYPVWYQELKIKKLPWVRWLCIISILFVIGIICTFVFENIIYSYASLITWLISMSIIGFIECSREVKVTSAAQEYCYTTGIYDLHKREFPFMPHLYQRFTIGGKSFVFEKVTINFYDTAYGKEPPGLILEVVPSYPLGSGVPTWNKKELIIPSCLDESTKAFVSKVSYGPIE